MKENHSDRHLQELLQNKFSDEYLAPPAEAWTNIEKSLIVSGKRRKPFFFFWILTGLLLLIGGSTYYVWNSKNKDDQSLAKNEEFRVEKRKNSQPSSNLTKMVEHKSSSEANQKKSNVTSKGKKTDREVLDSRTNQTLASQNNHKRNNTNGKFNPTRASHSKTAQRNPQKKEATNVFQPTSRLAFSTGTKGEKSEPNTPSKSSEFPKKTDERDGNVEKIAQKVEAEAEKPPVENKPTLPVSEKDSDSLLVHSPANEPDTTSPGVDDIELPSPPKSKNENKWEYDVFLGFGKNSRRNTNLGTSNSIVLSDKILRYKNRTIGMNFRYQMYPHIGFRTGFAFGSNRFTTRLFPVSIANDKLNQNLEIGTSDGVMRTSGLSSNGINANGTDTSTYLMRVIHRSGYLSVPVSVYFNTTKKPKQPYLYASTGFDFTLRGRERNLLVVRSESLDRNISLSRNRKQSGLATNWHANLGVAFPITQRTSFFTEINYAYNLSNGLKNNYIKTRYSYFQWVLGLRF